MKLKATPFVWVSFAMVVGVMGTALISPLYALYKDAWQLRPSDITLVYVIYMGGALFALLTAGRLPDRIGFRPVMLGGLVLALVGTAVSLVAWNMASLVVGRVLVGISSSLVMSSATTGLYRLARPGTLHRTAMLNSLLLAFGYGVGPLIGGVIGQWAPAPLVTAYVPTLILGSMGFIALCRVTLPDTVRPAVTAPLHWRELLPKLTWTTPELSATFVLTSCVPFLAFGVFGLYSSMAPLFLDKMVPWHGPAVSGIAIASILLSSAVFQLMAARLSTRWCGFVGLLGLAASNAVLMANLQLGSASLFALGVLLTAAGHGLSMLAGMRMLNVLASPGKLSGLLSTYMVIGYIGSMAPMMGMGWIADHWGLDMAVYCFCTLVILAGLTVAVLFLRNPRMR